MTAILLLPCSSLAILAASSIKSVPKPYKAPGIELMSSYVRTPVYVGSGICHPGTNAVHNGSRVAVVIYGSFSVHFANVSKYQRGELLKYLMVKREELCSLG